DASASRCAVPCRCPTTSATACGRSYKQPSSASRCSKARSIPICSAGWWCGSAIGSTMRRSVPSSKPSGTKSSREAVMRFKADEIVSVLQTEIDQYRSKIDAREVGRVLEVGDGIARIYGLSGVMSGEMVEFARVGVRGLAFNLEENSV